MTASDVLPHAFNPEQPPPPSIQDPGVGHRSAIWRAGAFIMARAVIADSDDDGDLGYSTPSQSPAEPSAHATCFLDHTTHFASTDPTFFQSVFDEQSEAARQHVVEPGQVPQYQGDGPQTSSAAPAGVDGYGHSSLMSTDPLHGRGDSGVNGQRPRATTRNTIPPVAHEMADDPWEIPSSPEETHNAAASRRKSRDKKSNGKKSKSKQTRPHSSLDQTQESPSINDEYSRRSSKKTKVNARQSSTHEAEDLDLVMLPSTQEVDKGFPAPTPSTMPPPTLLIDKSSFMVAPKPPTSSKRREHQNFTLDSDVEPSQDQGFARPAPGGTIARSSGSATNINTPRSDLPSSHNPDIDLGQHHQETNGGLETNDAGGQWNSSPDEIAAVGPTNSTLPGVKRKLRNSRMTAPVPAEAAGEPGTNNTPADARINDNDEDDGSNFVEKPVKKPVKQKKQRGRPRKSAGAEETSRATSPAPSHATGGRSATKPKKKRGRPRKADQQAVEAEPPGSVKLDDGTGGAAKSKEAIKTEGGGVDEEKHATYDQDKPADADETRFATALGADEHPVPDTLAKAGNQDQAALPPRPTSEMEVSKDISKKELAQEGREGKNAAGKLTGSAPGLSTASRPLYRVGLSKRSRIAPLLKSVRK